ncbi:hypothetical protein IWQ62_003566 [Dispira parvispora]|uniref:RING-type domain-containing protein n=1 Tax=Dispira parvispora TaxID=1520584 RepID=A0A9W8AQN4_9FUNG|nr:hypothetical protein IWQ62_003566 [Dispira parvispora]
MIDPDNYSVADNSSTVTLADRANDFLLQFPDSPRDLYEGVVVFAPDPRNTVLDDHLQYVALVNTSNSKESHHALLDLNKPSVQLVILYPSSRDIPPEAIVYASDEGKPSITVSYSIGQRLQSDWSTYTNDPNSDRGPSSDLITLPSNNVTANPDQSFPQRLWLRVYCFSGDKATSGPNSVVGAVLATVISVAVVILAILLYFLVIRKRRQHTRKRAQDEETMLTQRHQLKQSLLKQDVQSRNAPPLTMEKMHLLPTLLITKENYHSFPLASQKALQCFEMAYPHFITSSDEETDDEVDDDNSNAERVSDHRPLEEAQTPINNSMSPEPHGKDPLEANHTGDDIEPRTLPIMATMMAMKRATTTETVLGSPLPSPALPKNIESEPRTVAKKPLSPIKIPSEVTNYSCNTRPPSTSPPADANTPITQAMVSLTSISKSPSNSDPLSPRRLRKTLTKKCEEIFQKGPPICGVCMCDFNLGDLVRQLPCHHIFHPDCVDEWLTKKVARCPLCKFNCTPRRITFNQRHHMSSLPIPNFPSPVHYH